MSDKYRIARLFSRGYSAALVPEPRGQHTDEHWLAGWDAGYRERQRKSELLNVYLESIGVEKMGVVKLQEGN